MLDEPHEMRLHAEQAVHSSYNLKDPPGSLKLKYPGPQWVPDSLCASWCAAKTLTRCLPHGTPITYESTRRMLDCVLPCQHERCEVGIELMLMDSRFTTERAHCAHSSVDSSMLKLEPSGLWKSYRQSSPRTSCLQKDDLDKLLMSHQERMAELTRWCDELEHRLDSSYVELVKPAETTQEWVTSPSSLYKSSMRVVIREQSHKTVLSREPPKGSSLVDSKSSGRMVSEGSSKAERALPAVAKSALLNVEVTQSRLSPSQPTSPGGNCPRTARVVVQKVSTSETQNSLEQVHTTHSAASPSSSKLDYLT